MAKHKRDLPLEARWRKLLAKQARSGTGIREFCQREQFTKSAYYSWRRELRLRDRQPSASTPALVSVVMPQTTAVEPIILELRNGRLLWLLEQWPVA